MENICRCLLEGKKSNHKYFILHLQIQYFLMIWLLLFDTINWIYVYTYLKWDEVILCTFFVLLAILNSIRRLLIFIKSSQNDCLYLIGNICQNRTFYVQWWTAEYRILLKFHFSETMNFAKILLLIRNAKQISILNIILLPKSYFLTCWLRFRPSKYLPNYLILL